MKVLITTCALALLFTMFTIFQSDNNQYLRYQERLKYEADNCADAAVLFYDEESFAEGIKIFKKEDGNAAIKYLMKRNLSLDDSFTSKNMMISEQHDYYVYYFDGNGEMSAYHKDHLVDSAYVGFPYLFKEQLTGYEQMVYEATVIVTIDAGKADYTLSFISDPMVIRTSGYEYVQN